MDSMINVGKQKEEQAFFAPPPFFVSEEKGDDEFCFGNTEFKVSWSE